MSKLGSLRTEVEELFASGKSICLWYSGGADSTLLLNVLLQVGKPFGVLRFEDGWNKRQQDAVNAVIRENKLQVFTYPASAHVLIDEKPEIGLISQYAIDAHGNTAILVRDLVDDPAVCGVEIRFETAKQGPQTPAPVEYDIHLWGTRGDDEHWLSGDKPILTEKEWQIGEKRFIALLLDWDGLEVREALEVFDIQPASSDRNGTDTGNIYACHNCLMTTERVFCPKVKDYIDGVAWNGAENTEKVRKHLRIIK